MANIPKYFYFRVHVNMTSVEIEDASDVDVVEVVRCRDCKHCGYSPTHNQYWCEGKQVFAEHYCSRGERKPDETN